MRTHKTRTRNTNLIFNWFFITGLLVLLVNDHFAKWQYANWFTGKLSDFAGLLVFPMFLQFLFPRHSGKTVIITGAFFIFWKLPVSGDFIEVYNRIAPIPITRTVDYTDLIALIMLPLSSWLIQRIDSYRVCIAPPAVITWIVALPVAMIFMATSLPVSFYMKPGDDIHIGKYYKMKVTKQQALAKLRSKGYLIVPDTSLKEYMGRADYYVMKDVILDGGKDTIESLQFGFLGNGEKPLLLINNVKLKAGNKTDNVKVLKRYYRQLIRTDIVKETR